MSISFYLFYRFSSNLLFMVFAVILFVASIGCLRQRERGRLWMIRYAGAYLIALVVDMVWMILSYMIVLGTYVMQSSSNRYAFFYPRVMVNFASAMVMCIFPISILLFLAQPRVRAAFQE